jgi:hypothetical protein
MKAAHSELIELVSKGKEIMGNKFEDHRAQMSSLCQAHLSRLQSIHQHTEYDLREYVINSIRSYDKLLAAQHCLQMIMSANQKLIQLSQQFHQSSLNLMTEASERYQQLTRTLQPPRSIDNALLSPMISLELVNLYEFTLSTAQPSKSSATSVYMILSYAQLSAMMSSGGTGTKFAEAMIMSTNPSALINIFSSSNALDVFNICQSADTGLGSSIDDEQDHTRSQNEEIYGKHYKHLHNMLQSNSNSSNISTPSFDPLVFEDLEAAKQKKVFCLAM